MYFMLFMVQIKNDDIMTFYEFISSYRITE